MTTFNIDSFMFIEGDSFIGTRDAVGSQMNWSQIGNPTSGSMLTLNDSGSDGNLDDGVDVMGSDLFTGYVITINGVDLPVFRNGFSSSDFYTVPIPPSVATFLSMQGSFISGTSDPLASSVPLSSVTLCFAEGTGIATPDGEVAVETLVPGDLVRTADGRDVAVKWLGQQTVSKMFADPDRQVMVKICAGALDGATPTRDLYVTADHGLELNGVLVNAGALVGARGISWAKDVADSYTIYHVETEEHEMILAHGTRAESFIDYAGRGRFDNNDEYLALYGDEEDMRECTRARITRPEHLPAALRAQLGMTRVA